MRAMRKGDSCGTISYLLPLSLLMGQPRRTHTGFSRGVVFRSHAGAEPHYGRRAAGSLHLLSACGHQPDPSWRRVHQRCGGRLHLGHPAEHSRSAFKHRHAVHTLSTHHFRFNISSKSDNCAVFGKTLFNPIKTDLVFASILKKRKPVICDNHNNTQRRT